MVGKGDCIFGEVNWKNIKIKRIRKKLKKPCTDETSGF